MGAVLCQTQTGVRGRAGSANASGNSWSIVRSGAGPADGPSHHSTAGMLAARHVVPAHVVVWGTGSCTVSTRIYEANSLWSRNVPDSGEFDPTFQRVFSESAYAGSNPTCSAVLFPLVAKPSTCPPVRHARRSLWSAISWNSGLGALTTGCPSLLVIFRFPIPHAGDRLRCEQRLVRREDQPNHPDLPLGRLARREGEAHCLVPFRRCQAWLA